MFPFPDVHLVGPTRRPLRDNLHLILFALLLVPIISVARGIPVEITVPAILIGLLVPAWGLSSILRRESSFCGPADRITLFRTVLTGGVASLALISLPRLAPICPWATLMLAIPAITLDGVDGYVARRTGTTSDDGARFDVDADALLVLALSLAVSVVVGWWAVLIGLMRYAYVAAAWFRPSLKHRLPFSQFRRVVGLMQGLVLCLALLPAMPSGMATILVALSLTLLVISFGRDV